MCGRFTQVVKAVELAALYGVAASGVELQPRWNGAPTQAFLVCRLDAAGRRAPQLEPVVPVRKQAFVGGLVRGRALNVCVR